MFTPKDCFDAVQPNVVRFRAFFGRRRSARRKSPDFMKLWGFPFVLVGLYMVVGRFVLDAWLRRGARYAVTNKRVLISRPLADRDASRPCRLRQRRTSSSRLTRMVGGPFAAARRYAAGARRNGSMATLLARSHEGVSGDRRRAGRVDQIIQEAAEGDAA